MLNFLAFDMYNRGFASAIANSIKLFEVLGILVYGLAFKLDEIDLDVIIYLLAIPLSVYLLISGIMVYLEHFSRECYSKAIDRDDKMD